MNVSKIEIADFLNIVNSTHQSILPGGVLDKWGGKARGGWTYRTAYFEDFDGKYYETTISAAQSDAGKMIYNVGQMQERSTPQINGSSSAGTGAQWGSTSSTDSVRAEGKNVNRKYSPEARDANAEQLGSENSTLISQPAADSFPLKGEAMGTAERPSQSPAATALPEGEPRAYDYDQLPGKARALVDQAVNSAVRKAGRAMSRLSFAAGIFTPAGTFVIKLC